MYRFVLVFVGVVATVAQSKRAMHECGRLAHGGMACCKKEGLSKTQASDDPALKECFQMARKPPPSCDLDLCIAKKTGLAKDDGTMDKKKITEAIEKSFESDADLADSIKKDCVNGDLTKYGPPDMCEVIKHKMCVDIHIYKSCDDWSDEGECSGMKELAEKCVKEFQ